MGLLLVLTLGIRMSRIDQVGLAPPEVLSAKAREILGRLGYTAAPADWAEGFAYATDVDRYFDNQPRLIGPWTKPERMRSQEDEDSKQHTRSVLVTVVGGTAILGGILLALRNYVRGRGDRRGAFRLAAFVFASHMLLWVFRTHLVVGIDGFGLFLVAMGNALFGAALVWALYLSFEPYVRRHWPQAIISWSRLLAGRVRDPLLGHDLLLGVILGIVWCVIVELSYLVIAQLGGPPTLGATGYLRGGRYILGAWLGQAVTSVQGALLFFFVLFLFRVLLRRPWLAATAFVALFATSRVLGNEYAAVQIPTSIAIFGIAAFAVVRFGLVALAAGLFTAELIISAPMPASLSSWYATAPAFVFLSILGLAVWGFYASLGGRPLWSGNLFD